MNGKNAFLYGDHLSMDVINPQTFQELTTRESVPSLSLFLPTHRAGKERKEDIIRFRNLLADAKEQLEKVHGFSPKQSNEFLHPLYERADDSLFWKDQIDGLAVFLSKDFLVSFALPVPFEERIVLSDHFFVTPLVPMLKEHRHFYILAVSKQKIRLLAATDESVTDLLLKDFSDGFRKGFGYEKGEPGMQQRKTAKGTMVHGHGGLKDQKKPDLMNYVRYIDEHVTALLRGSRAPLVFAGVEEIFGHYRKICSYPNLLPRYIRGNPDELSKSQLHRKAALIAGPEKAKRKTPLQVR